MWQLKNDRQTNRSDTDRMQITEISDGQINRSDTNRIQTTEVSDMSLLLPSVSDVSIRDLSTWVGGRTFDRVDDRDPSRFSAWVPEFSHSDSEKRLKEIHGDLDGILQKLQEMLASNFASEGTVYNTQSQHMDSKNSQTYNKKMVISVVNVERYMISSLCSKHRIWVEDITEGN